MSKNEFCLSLNRTEKRGWILFLGAMQVLCGFIAIAFVGATSLISIVYLGALLLMVGVAEVVFGLRHPKDGALWFHLFFGVLALTSGWLILRNPVANLILLTAVLGIYFITSGLVTFVGSIMERFDQWGWFAINGLITTVVGVMISFNLIESSTWLIGLMVGIQMLTRGIAWLSLVILSKRLSSQRAA